MGDSTDWKVKMDLPPGRNPFSEIFSNLADILAGQTCSQCSLEVVHSRGGIPLHKRNGNLERHLCQSRLVAGVMECECISVIDDIRREPCLFCGPVKQRNCSVKIAIPYGFERFFVTHAAILD